MTLYNAFVDELDKLGFWPFTKSKLRKSIDAWNRQAGILNKPENLKILNRHLAAGAKKTFGKSLAHLNSEEWQRNYAGSMSNKALRKRLGLGGES